MTQKRIVDPVKKLRALGIENPREVVQIVRENFRLRPKVKDPTPNSAKLANRLTDHIERLYGDRRITQFDIKKLDADEMNAVLSIVKRTARIPVPTRKGATVVTSDVSYNYNGSISLTKRKMRHRYTLVLSAKMSNPKRLYPGRLNPTSILSIQIGDSSPIRRTRPMSARFKDAVKQFQARLKEAGVANFALTSITRKGIKKAVPRVTR
jgi:hypothetical protein